MPSRRIDRTRARRGLALTALAAILLAACGGNSIDPASAPAQAPPADSPVAAPAPAVPAPPDPEPPPPAVATPAPQPPPATEGAQCTAAEHTVAEPPVLPAPEREPPEPAEPPGADFLIALTDPADTDLLQRIGMSIAERRGLSLLRDVPVSLIRRSDLGEYLLATLDESDRAELGFDESVFRLLGLLGPNDSLPDLFRDLYVGLVLGFYDPEDETFVIVSSNDHIAVRDLDTIIHEFVHALQDQHYDLDARFDQRSGNSDAALALRFVVEGDARTAEPLLADLHLQFAAGLEPARDRLPGTSQQMPPALQNIFNGPYREGVSAITAVLDTQGRAGVDALLADPPASTEQLLHPDKLADREPPLTISDPDVIEALGSGWAAIDSDTFGEFQLRVYLDVELSRAAAAAGAGGWGGDRLTLYRAGDGDELIAWRLRWDDAAEAKEFLAQFHAWLVARSAGAVQPIAAGAGYRWTGENQAFWVYGREADTWLLVASDADDLNRVAAAVLQPLALAEVG